MNVQDLVNLSLTLCGRLGAGRTAGGAESQVVLGIANAMLDSWSTKRLAVYSVNLSNWPLVAGTETYTIGTGGVFNTARPVTIQSASIVATVAGQVGRFPMRVIGQDEFSQIESYGDQTAIPKLLYFDAAFPLATLYLFPIPASSSTSLDLYTWQAFAQFTAPVGTLSTVATAVTWVSGTKFDPGWAGGSITINGVAYTVASVTSPTALVLSATAGTQTTVAFGLATFLSAISFPPGYQRAINYNLAVEIAAAFGLKVPDVVAQIALSSKASIEAINGRLMPDMELDRETSPPDRSSKPGNGKP